ncbi:MAG: cob(I)yrinic acid a,c-diamide adenosyltransferase [Nitrospirae bacterium]|nr:cob(I)yrinic acid a,c-diamide adenosyltransferase [Nitrospirota bacterium]
MKSLDRGLIIVHTGEGKGKTTAALGLAVRAMGQGLRVLIIQFIKGAWKTGEQELAKRYADLCEIYAVGEGFTWDTKNPEQDKQKVREGWELAMERLRTGRFDLLILDEMNCVLSYGYFPVEEVLRFLKEKPPALHVVLTGRGAPPEIVAAADLVTEMLAIKHPYEQGYKARRGIEF